LYDPLNLSIQTGELTPTLKIKRQRILANWKSEIDKMYQASHP